MDCSLWDTICFPLFLSVIVREVEISHPATLSTALKELKQHSYNCCTSFFDQCVWRHILLLPESLYCGNHCLAFFIRIVHSYISSYLYYFLAEISPLWVL